VTETPEPYSVQLKATEIVLQIPQPLAETLRTMAQYRRCTLEALVVRLIADNAVVQKYFTREALALWSRESEE